MKFFSPIYTFFIVIPGEIDSPSVCSIVILLSDYISNVWISPLYAISIYRRIDGFCFGRVAVNWLDPPPCASTFPLRSAHHYQIHQRRAWLRDMNSLSASPCWELPGRWSLPSLPACSTPQAYCALWDTRAFAHPTFILGIVSLLLWALPLTFLTRAPLPQRNLPDFSAQWRTHPVFSLWTNAMRFLGLE